MCMSRSKQSRRHMKMVSHCVVVFLPVIDFSLFSHRCSCCTHFSNLFFGLVVSPAHCPQRCFLYVVSFTPLFLSPLFFVLTVASSLTFFFSQERFEFYTRSVLNLHTRRFKIPRQPYFIHLVCCVAPTTQRPHFSLFCDAASRLAFGILVGAEGPETGQSYWGQSYLGQSKLGQSLFLLGPVLLRPGLRRQKKKTVGVGQSM